MLKPEIIPPGGFNLEYRQLDEASDGYLYSKGGADGESFQNDVYDDLAETVSFGSGESVSDLTKGVLATGLMYLSSVIFPYPGDPPSSLPTSFTIPSKDKTVDFLLIARIRELEPLDKLWSKATIERRTDQTILKGGVLQELISEQGERYAMVSAFNYNTEKFNVDEVGGLSDLSLPKGYTYESRKLSEDFTIRALEVAYILIDKQFNFQKYDEDAPH